MRLGPAVIAAVCLAVPALLPPAETAASTADPTSPSSRFAPLADLVGTEIAAGHVPGAVVLIGQQDAVLYRQAFGLRAAGPDVPMSLDTIFDLASLTKVVATTTAVMQLVEHGLLELDRPAAAYWPAFGIAGKQRISVRDLLTHYSGLRADLSLDGRWSGYDSAMSRLIAERPLYPAGTRYIYSDENFEVLGEIVRRISGMPLDRYCDAHIFEPLGMVDTHFRPAGDHLARIAPTGFERPGSSVGARVNDPTAERMGGVAGHAGLFSTADDLAVFATMLLDGGTARGVQVLGRQSIALMTRPASPSGGDHLRGLGWNLMPLVAQSSNAERLPAGSYGHTGYTGTMLWLEPLSKTYVIVLTNRTYPHGLGDAEPLRRAILERVSSTLVQQAAYLD